MQTQRIAVSEVKIGDKVLCAGDPYKVLDRINGDCAGDVYLVLDVIGKVFYESGAQIRVIVGA